MRLTLELANDDGQTPPLHFRVRISTLLVVVVIIALLIVVITQQAEIQRMRQRMMQLQTQDLELTRQALKQFNGLSSRSGVAQPGPNNSQPGR
jgi:hypothetical protein